MTNEKDNSEQLLVEFKNSARKISEYCKNRSSYACRNGECAFSVGDIFGNYGCYITELLDGLPCDWEGILNESKSDI